MNQPTYTAEQVRIAVLAQHAKYQYVDAEQEAVDRRVWFTPIRWCFSSGSNVYRAIRCENPCKITLL